MLDFMVNHSYFFIFVTWYSWIIVWILGGIHKNVGRKIWNFGGIHEMQKKKIETTWCLGWARGHIFASAAQRLRPRALRALPRPPPLRGGGEKCPRTHPRHQVVSIYFIFAFHETTKVSNFLPTFLWNHPKFKQLSMKPGHKKKWVVSY